MSYGLLVMFLFASFGEPLTKFGTFFSFQNCRRDRAKAVEILVKDLKVFSAFNEELFKEITQLLTLENFRFGMLCCCYHLVLAYITKIFLLG